MKMENVEDIYPLSPVQQGMLFHTLYAPGSGVYITQTVCTLEGDLDADLLEQAWQRVVSRHPVLRTAFVWEGFDEPLQVVRRQVTLPWQYHDWQELSPQAQQERLQAFLLEDRTRGFELIKAPLMRLALLRLTKERYQMVWSSHHMLLDGWSLPLLLRQVFTYYAVPYHREDIDLPQPRPYRDYIAWLQQQDMAQAESFWKAQLQGFAVPTRLPVGRGDDHAPEPAAPPRKPRLPPEVSLWLSAETTQALQTLAQRHRLTLNVLAKGAWALLLSRYSGAQDILFGASFSGRPVTLPGAESMIGLFTSTLPIRLQVPPDAPLLAWLQTVQGQQIELQPYEYSPLVNIQEWSEIPRGTPLFESLFVFENYPTVDEPQSQDGALKLCDLWGMEETHYPLTVSVAAVGQRLNLRILYDDARFDHATVARMAGHCGHILEDMATDPARRLADVSLLTETERRQIVIEWNDAPRRYPDDLLLHDLYAAQVARTPDAVATLYRDHSLTFRQLDQQANRLANLIRRLLQ